MIFKICYFSIELSDVQGTGEEDLTEGKTYITKTDQILKCTKVNLVGVDSIIAIDIPSAPGKFVCFKDCLIVHNPDVLSLKERLSPSGLFKITFNEKKNRQKTASRNRVCNVQTYTTNGFLQYETNFRDI